MSNRPPVVIDNGTGYTKMGYSGNVEPQFIIPTVLGTKPEDSGGGAGKRDGLEVSAFSSKKIKENAHKCHSFPPTPISLDRISIFMSETARLTTHLRIR